MNISRIQNFTYFKGNKHVKNTAKYNKKNKKE